MTRSRTSLMLWGLLPALAVMICVAGPFRWHVFPKRWGVVEPGQIFRSGRINPRLLEKTLRGHDIKAIINLSPRDRRSKPEEEDAAAMGIDVEFIPMSGNGMAPPEQYAEAVAKIIQFQDENKPVLIHCAAGAQRTGAVIALYRLLVQRTPSSDVVNEMERYGWSPKKSADLLTYMNAHMAEVATLLVAKGVLDRVPSPIPSLKS